MGKIRMTVADSYIADLRTHKRLLTTTDVMEILPYGRGTLCGWVRTGRLPGIRMPDNSYLFDSVALADWLQQRSM